MGHLTAMPFKDPLYFVSESESPIPLHEKHALDLI